MNPAKVRRDKLERLSDLPNVGPAIAADLRRIGIFVPDDLRGKEPWDLYTMLCDVSGSRHDPCVLDVFISITDFMEGGEPKVWWAYTGQRKARYKI